MASLAGHVLVAGSWSSGLGQRGTFSAIVPVAAHRGGFAAQQVESTTGVAGCGRAVGVYDPMPVGFFGPGGQDMSDLPGLPPTRSPIAP